MAIYQQRVLQEAHINETRPSQRDIAYV